MHIYRTAPGLKTALICIMFMFAHFYIQTLRGSAIKKLSNHKLLH